MPQFSVSKGTLKLKDIESIEILSERIDDNIYLHSEVKLKSGKSRQIGGLRLANEMEAHPPKHLVSFKLPNDRTWQSAFDKLKPDELQLKFADRKSVV